MLPSPYVDSSGILSSRYFVRGRLPINFISAPLIAILILLAIGAINRQELHDGTVGKNNISPINIAIFYLALGYITTSIEASGAIRFMAFRILQWRVSAHKLFLYLCISFFGLGILVGSDPIMVSILLYFLKASMNVVHPRAWIHTQFAVANMATTILVSSSPANLALVSAFNIKFIDYTANVAVPVVISAVLLFPFLLYVDFATERLIPSNLRVYELLEEAKRRKPVNPNISWARGLPNDEESQAWDHVNEIMNPFLDKAGASFGSVLLFSTIIILLVLNAVYLSSDGHPDYWVTLPAGSITFLWDLAFGWRHRRETRELAREGRLEIERDRLERVARRAEQDKTPSLNEELEESKIAEPTVMAIERLHVPQHQVERRSGLTESSDLVENAIISMGAGESQIHQRSEKGECEVVES